MRNRHPAAGSCGGRQQRRRSAASSSQSTRLDQPRAYGNRLHIACTSRCDRIAGRRIVRRQLLIVKRDHEDVGQNNRIPDRYRSSPEMISLHVGVESSRMTLLPTARARSPGCGSRCGEETGRGEGSRVLAFGRLVDVKWCAASRRRVANPVPFHYADHAQPQAAIGVPRRVDPAFLTHTCIE